jgi:SAM-dependent methyltransferase
MDEMKLLVEFHKGGLRQGPGGDDETRLAIQMSGLRGQRDLRIADIGCGTGASTIVLANELDAHITAVDFLPDFLAVLDAKAKQAGVATRIATVPESMDRLPFENASLDAIWSEGAIYNMGFEAGIKAWKRFLKLGGILAVSELTWLTDERPAELQAHWDREYPEVATASSKLAVLEANGFSPIGYFALPLHCWLDNYYNPIKARIPAFLEAHGQSETARAIVEAEEKEIALFDKHSDFVSYGYYIARNRKD